MAVSANTLFHFSSSENLKSIITSGGFFVAYSDEHFENILNGSHSKFRMAYTPMISFCDLTIMQLAGDSKHRTNFGEYGIGLTKEWGMENRISPVVYVHEKSQPSSQLYNLNLYLGAMAKKKGGGAKLLGVKKELVDLFKFIKPYQGRWHKGERIADGDDDIIYYNEREWRYCPLLDEYKVLLGASAYNKKRKAEFNATLKNNLVHFKPEHIKFIVIKKKSEISEFVKVIKALKLEDSEMENQLITKIISFEEIKEDY